MELIIDGVNEPTADIMKWEREQFENSNFTAKNN